MSVTTCTCDDNLYVDDDGVLRVKRESFGLRERLVFSSGGTFHKGDYPWLARVYAKVLGGGGAGGGSENVPANVAAAGGGGGGGTWAEKLVDVGSLSDTELITVGQGGAGATDAEGGNGGFSAFGSHAVGMGGQGGSRGPANAGTSQTILGLGFAGIGAQSGSIGDVIVLGSDGDFGYALGASSLTMYSGFGGSTALAGTRAGVTSSGDGRGGQDATGQGGSGAGSLGGGGEAAEAFAGGAGGSGIVIVDLYG